ncbi:TetM/TetW/TetO/TetS family tetracycline resistance ribosomal protection protein [Lactobacillus gasseri]|jgi:translation elongation factor 2 (EF-2/EF-G)|uniref:GTP-binding protein n=1 Tax=Lactobacillus gasseri TaxID=1596 RepID=UPI000764006E|nr:TetM/TetW/TetO/TetS family tetracycline resistance ribosomal protection protein [Lactobacillus gasseri]KXA26120.1 putative translation elongation factor G [Lactobacillus gasseri]MCT7705464.1 TetM/TetW/TetO/TetS family tetracycline resistance ribosomal protection protein [Lactobacillus gasseri]MCZ3484691.1 TetM/TetW/TetO/TetS family tetracycline resistance ribosomal protection protein [Lactobacillus gasseri]MCZ3486425.1 TetM/TetW/TetO/TetS family tetracycline resistance ribosomal protection p
MKKVTIGILAHVDAGKTTLSEGLLYQSGTLRKLGAVDKGTAYLDNDNLEKKRGITIFSHMARIKTENSELLLLDTPGHIDFAQEMEETLSVLDYAILVVSASEGVTAYTQTLWNLLKSHKIPTFIFVNKMDTLKADKEKVLHDLSTLDDSCVEFGDEDSDFYEKIATADEAILEEYLESGQIKDKEIQDLISQRKVFPVYFGAALKLKGVAEFLQGLDKWTKKIEYSEKFASRIFKISHDEKGERLTWLKVTGGELRAKSELMPDEKVNEIRLYNGNKYEVVSSVQAGEIVAVSGLKTTYPGQDIGFEKDQMNFTMQPVLNYAVQTTPDKTHATLAALRQLEDENPQLHVKWDKQTEEISIDVMGKIQLEILQQILHDRFNLEVEFTQGKILYQESIRNSVEGVGHFEPLRHYAEVHLLLKPGKLGSGLVFKNECSLEVLPKKWQDQVMESLANKEHLGVLTGSPLTDVEITLIGGRGSNVHTVGGDFREATYRAVRQGLMELKAQNQVSLLEPWYQFTLRINQDQVGRAINDIEKMGGKFKIGESDHDIVTITGQAPVAQMQDYATEVRNYSHGSGQLECLFAGYQECKSSAEVIADANYDPVSDINNTPNSVFCSHGAGHTVVWDEVPSYAQYPYLKS